MDTDQQPVPIRRPEPPSPPRVPSLPGTNRPLPPKPPVPPVPPSKPPAKTTPSSAPQPLPGKPPSKPLPSRTALVTTPPSTSPAPAAAIDPEVLIRTMQDDIAEIKAGNAGTTPARMSPGKTPAPVPAPAPLPATSPPAPTPAARTFPLPPRSGATSSKVVVPPHVTQRHSSWKWVGALIIILVLLGGGGAAAWYLYFGTSLAPTSSSKNAVAPAAEVLPAEAPLILHYQLTTGEARAQVLTAWNAKGGEPLVSGLLAGDPRILLQDPNLTEFFLVVLADNSRPYVVVPKTTETTKLIASGSEVRYYEQSGWYIAHAVTIDPYKTALAAGTLATSTSASVLTQNVGQVPLRLIIGQNLVPQLRQNVAGESFVGGSLQSLVLGVNMNASPGLLTMQGSAATLQEINATVTNPALLARIPIEANVVRLGANFNDDLQQWLSLAAAIDDNVLSRPLVAQQLAQLTTPYAYFTFPTSSAADSLGLIIDIPPALQHSVIVGEPAVEEGLLALVPLILDRRTIAPLSFADGNHAGTALRYANIVGTTQALDYAVSGNQLLIASSKDAMFALLETVQGTHTSLQNGRGTDPVVATLEAVTPLHDLVLGTLSLPSIVNLLPATTTQVNFGVALQPGQAGAAPAQAVIDLGTVSAPIN